MSTGGPTVIVPLYTDGAGGLVEVGEISVPLHLDGPASGVVTVRPDVAAASPAESPNRPITAPECVETAAAALRHAEQMAGHSPKSASALVEIADGWASLGIALATTGGLTRSDEPS